MHRVKRKWEVKANTVLNTWLYVCVLCVRSRAGATGTELAKKGTKNVCVRYEIFLAFFKSNQDLDLFKVKAVCD